ncbi:meiosis protein SPO22/ZIP4 like-domain-containing protein [Aspergillus falconensis]
MATKYSSRPKDLTRSILALAAELQNQLTHIGDSDTLVLDRETLVLLEKTLRRLPFPANSISTFTRRQLDSEGTKLWNACLLQLRTTEADTEVVLLCKVKAFAYAMVDAAAPKTILGNYRSLELAFKLVKACIEHGLINLAQKIMESATARLDLIERSKPDTDIVRVEAVAIEYYMLRIYLAWSQKRLHIADHMFSEIRETKSTEQQRVVVDICYTIGGSALKAGQYGTAATWLGRALKVCETWSNDEIPAVAQSLRDKKLLALHAYARSNLHLTTAVFETQLRKTIDLLRTEYGDSFPVLVFSLEVLNKDALNEEYFTTLKSSTKEMDNDGTNVEIIFHYVMKLGCLGPELFVEACEQLLIKLSALDTTTKEQWMEKIFVSVIWTLTGTRSNDDRCPKLAEAAAQVLTDCGLSKPSEDATQASLILIWKYIDTMLSKGSISTAEQWCRFLLQQPMFKQAPDIETKSFRKLILCVLEKYSPSTARQILDEIPDDCRACPLTLYLMCRLALLADNTALAISYIQSLCMQGVDAPYIWSCLADALQIGTTHIALKSLEGVIAVLDDSGFGRLQLPQMSVDVICAAALAAVGSGQRGPFSSDELRWLSCKSYGIALELYKSLSIQAVVKLLDISKKLCQKSTTKEPNTGILEHYLKCAFLQSMIIVTDARQEIISNEKERRYKEAREAIKQFQIHIQSLGIDCIARKPVVGFKLSSVFLDCLLRSGAPPSYLSKAVKLLQYLPRHLRCLFSASIQAEECILAESVLDQALLLARRELNSNSNSGTRIIAYPKDELQWLATTAFNRAVEFFLVSAGGDYRRPYTIEI